MREIDEVKKNFIMALEFLLENKIFFESKGYANLIEIRKKQKKIAQSNDLDYLEKEFERFNKKLFSSIEDILEKTQNLKNEKNAEELSKLMSYVYSIEYLDSMLVDDCSYDEISEDFHYSLMQLIKFVSCLEKIKEKVDDFLTEKEDIFDYLKQIAFKQKESELDSLIS